jgi:hypothetical protein
MTLEYAGRQKDDKNSMKYILVGACRFGLGTVRIASRRRRIA